MTALTLYANEVHRLLSIGSVLVLRPIKPQPDSEWMEFAIRVWGPAHAQPINGDKELRCPLGAPGTIAWVRETWQAIISTGYNYHTGMDGVEVGEDFELVNPTPGGAVIFRADDSWAQYGDITWRSPVTMPRWASRCDVTVQDVRVLRVEDVDDADAVHAGWTDRLALGLGLAARYAYRALAHQAYDIPAWAWAVTVQRNA